MSDSVFRPLAGAFVEVFDGTQAGASTRADAAGSFSLGGIIVGAKIRASKEGYVSEVRVVQSPDLQFILGVDGPSADIAGSYTLTVDADPSCADLPGEVRRRSYAATVVPETPFSSWPPNTVFRANLSGDGLDAYFHFVPLYVAGNVVLFDMSDNGIEEEVAEETYVFVGGTGRTTVQSDGSMSAAVSGVFDYCVVAADPGKAYPCSDRALERIRCEAPNHRLTLTRRSS